MKSTRQETGCFVNQPRSITYREPPPPFAYPPKASVGFKKGMHLSRAPTI